MAVNLTQAIRTYDFVGRMAIDLGTVDTSDPNIAQLTKVNALMATGASALTSRCYEPALAAYHAAESLIYSMLDPQWVPDMGTKFWPVLSREPAMFTPLLSATSQWLNILPVPPAPSPVRPTGDAQVEVGEVAGLSGAGLSLVSSNPTAAFKAMADMRLASIYAGQDNTAAESVVVKRAEGLDATLAKALNPSGTAPVRSAKAKVAAADVRVEAVRQPTVTAAQASAPVAIVETTPLQVLPSLPMTVLAEKSVGVVSSADGAFAVSAITWASNSNPAPPDIVNHLYEPHVVAGVLPDALNNLTTPWELAMLLPHDYFYVIPLALASCYQAMGDWATAETYYLMAASYQYINTAVEGPYVWTKLAELYSAWGDSSYMQGDSTTAATQYSKVLTVGSTTPPTTQLYTLAGLDVAAQIATTLIPQLPTLASTGTGGVSVDDLAIASVLLKIWVKLNQIDAGLDFWGQWADAIPIWPFSYLQQVAINFAELAQGAEQQVINYWSQADSATLTQTQLQNQVAAANAQVSAAQATYAQAQAQATVYQDGLTLAQTRATDAADNANEYAATNSSAIVLQAEATQNAGGDSGDWNQVTSLAAQLLAGQTISADNPTLEASADLAANQLSQDYQVDSMNRTAAEMQQAATQAQDQVTAANAQVTAAKAGVTVAQTEASGASQALAVFNSATFTPLVWWEMGNYMLSIYQRYMTMALGAAKLMQHAYNFENDTTVSYIQSSYAGLIDGLLAADALMADIQQFTYDLITDKRGKKQYLKKSISLATNYGYQFLTQLVADGEMTFETTLDDFDTAFPGTYQSRIQSVSVDIQGIVPPTGVSGTLTNGGISFFRLPSDIASGTTQSKLRIQDSDTLVLSDYNPNTDGQLNSLTGNQLGIFEGAGVASTWTLALPKALNNINYGTLTDVVLTMLFESRFDPQLVPTVLAELAGRPGFYERQWVIPLAWLYPDLFYGFVNSGSLTLNLAEADFPFNQTSPVVTAVGVLVVMEPGTPATGITLSLTPPGKSAVTGATDASGSVSSQGSGSLWSSAAGGTALGSWTIDLPAASNPGLYPGGTLDLSSLINLSLVLNYNFTPRS